MTTFTIKDVVASTKNIETILGARFGATGRGLYEKTASVTPALPDRLVKRIRYVATLRNKAMHEDGFEINDLAAYVADCQAIAAELEQIHASRQHMGQRAPAAAPTASVGNTLGRGALMACAVCGLIAMIGLSAATLMAYLETSNATRSTQGSAKQ